jgi:NADPH:quinone reductase-like Zn-dependent oxidoreductase
MVTARTWVATGFGGAEVLRNIGTDVPDPGSGQVTIGVRACGMNPGIGVAAGLALLTLSLRYEHRRLTPVVLSSYVA